MATTKLYARIHVSRWIGAYLWFVKLRAKATRRMPDMAKVEQMVSRSIRVSVETNP